MTPKERAAMQQALGALVRAEAMYGQPNADIQAALREALDHSAEDTEMVQEPVAVVFEEKKKAFADCKQKVKAPDDVWTVSDAINFFGFFSHGWEYAKKYYTAPQPVSQEPADYWIGYNPENGGKWLVEHTEPSKEQKIKYEFEPVYTAPQPVKEVELTDEEIEWLVVDTLETWNSKDTMKDFARAVIAAYREKQK